MSSISKNQEVKAVGLSDAGKATLTGLLQMMVRDTNPFAKETGVESIAE